jgi:hypothetical protein
MTTSFPNISQPDAKQATIPRQQRPITPRVIAGEYKRSTIRAFLGALALGFFCAEMYRRYHTIPHIQRRTEYYRRLGVEFKSIID